MNYIFKNIYKKCTKNLKKNMRERGPKITITYLRDNDMATSQRISLFFFISFFFVHVKIKID